MIPERERPQAPAAEESGAETPRADAVRDAGETARWTRPFHGVLFANEADAPRAEAREEPDFFHDLRLDCIVAAITAGREEYDLTPFFYAPLDDSGQVSYRQEIMRDLEDPAVKRAIESFAECMRTVRRSLAVAAKSSYDFERQRWLLAAAETYGDGVEQLDRDLGAFRLASRGLRSFRSALGDYVRSEVFRGLALEAREVAGALAAIRYGMWIRDGSVTVVRDAGEIDYSVAVQEAFAKFREGRERRYDFRFGERQGMDHVDAGIVERVALLFPAPFDALARFAGRRTEFVAVLIARFDREIQFYLAVLDYVGRFRRAGLPFCFPTFSNPGKDIVVRDAYDLALADRLLAENEPIVRNDFHLRGAERFFVVTGPNQGGKTTFARTVGQLHCLARLGCPVPGRQARLFLCDRILTHFGREEEIATQRGELENDLVRARGILERATPNSVVIVNEIFSSTSAEDALFLSREIMDRLARLDLVCVWVTFLDELAALGRKTVSMVAAVDPTDPTTRTFKVERRPADGLAYALAIAEKHRVTERWLKERLPS
ncbi:MAG TPA: DNA mismatch repair protein MutS [Thermoanaerobaculia bacterium]